MKLNIKFASLLLFILALHATQMEALGFLIFIPFYVILGIWLLVKPNQFPFLISSIIFGLSIALILRDLIREISFGKNI